MRHINFLHLLHILIFRLLISLLHFFFTPSGNMPEKLEPHFVLVPVWAQGHVIPMVDMGLLLAAHGARVTLVTTPLNAARIGPIIDRAEATHLPIRFLALDFPCAEAGLPEGCENVDTITSDDLRGPFFRGLQLLRRPLEGYLRDVQPSPTCIISDNIQWWTMGIAEELNIPRLIFHGPSCFYSLCIHSIRRHHVYDNLRDEFATVLVPNLPHGVAVCRAQTPIWFDEPGYEDLLGNMTKSEETADGVVVNTFRELEPEYVELYERAIGKRVWPIGPLSLHDEDTEHGAARGNKTSIDKGRLLNWLDSKDPGSVVFVSFGSLVKTSPEQIVEIGRGLEESDRPFIWVIKEWEKCPEVDAWMSSGFGERTGKRGLIITGWAPQVVILSHPSVGGFITHCGWNSILEAISGGVPMITLPHFGDQFLNEKFVVEILKIGVSLGVKEPSSVTEKGIVRVTRDQIRNAVLSLMDAGKEGEERRAKARECGKMARKAMEEGGSSYGNVTRLIQFATENAKEEGVEGI